MAEASPDADRFRVELCHQALASVAAGLEEGGVDRVTVARAAMAATISIGRAVFGDTCMNQWLRDVADQFEDDRAARLAAQARRKETGR